MKSRYAAVFIFVSLAAIRCQPYTPYKVSSEETEQVLRLPPEQQINAYLARVHKSKPPNPFLAFVIAPNIDIQKQLMPRIRAETDDVAIADLLFLAKVVCDQHGGCSQDRNLIEEMRNDCNRISDLTLRQKACVDVSEIEKR